jgi:hypothetical protein
LWNAEQGCYYDHEHKDNPRELDPVFGTWIYEIAGGEISYPWQTFKMEPGTADNYPQPIEPGATENEHKHEGYGWLTLKDIPCNQSESTGCVTHARAQYHAIFAGPGAVTRYHSYWLEARGCLQSSPDTCGIIRTGGWLDFGYLYGEKPDGERVVVQLPDMPSEPIEPPTGPKRSHKLRAGDAPNASAVWYGFNRDAAVSPKIAILTNDVWQNIDVNDPGAIKLFCPDFQCNKNGSTMQLHQFAFFAQRSLDQDDDGRIDFNGYVDRYGNIVEGCTDIGLDCVPLVIEGLPIEPQDEHFTRYLVTVDAMQEYDISPDGEWWIEYPN